MSRATELRASPVVWARTGGALYVFIILAGLYGEAFVRANLIVAGNAAATAERIAASELLFRSGIVADLLMHVCDLPLTLIFYLLLVPVSRKLSLLAVFFGIVQTAILCANKLNLVAVVLLLGGRNYATAFDAKQVQALVSFYLAMHEYGFGIGLLFFAFNCFVAGYLIYQSGYLPKMVGVLQAMAGLCYLINSLALLLVPSFAAAIFPAILLPAFVGELGTALWLLVMGVNRLKWDERRVAGCS